MKTWLWNKGYPQKLVEREIIRVKFSMQKVQRKADKKVVPVIVTYALLINCSVRLFTTIYIFYTGMENLKAFSHQVPWFPVEAWVKLAHSWLEVNCSLLKDQFDRINIIQYVAKFVQIWMRSTPSLALLLEKSIEQTMNLTVLIILLTYIKYSKQYVCQAVDNSPSRWNNYKSNCKKYAHGETCIQEHLFDYLFDNDHVDFYSAVARMFIVITDPSNPLKCGKCENYSKYTVKHLCLIAFR